MAQIKILFVPFIKKNLIKLNKIKFYFFQIDAVQICIKIQKFTLYSYGNN